MTHQILHVINTAEVGGGAEHILHLVPGLARHGFASSVAVGRDGPMADRLRQIGVSVAVMGPLGITRTLSLAGRFRKMQPALIHLHGSRSGVIGSLAARATRVRPIIYTAHAFAFRRRLPATLRWMAARAEALTCRLADQVICLNQADLSEAAKWGIPTRHFTVIPNGVPIPRRGGTDRRKELFGFDSNAPVVGMIARLVPQKDPLTFVQMAQHVAKVVPAARFLLVGDGPLRRQVEAAVETMALRDRVITTGFRNDVPELLRAMDVVVLTSLWEGLPFVLLEAMAAEKPVVATRVGGPLEVVVDGETGSLVPAQDPVRLAAAVTHLLQNPSQRHRMGEKGRERVEREFSVDRMINATVQTYQAGLSDLRVPQNP